MTAYARKQERIKLSIAKEFREQVRLRSSFERKLRLQLITFFAEVGQQAQREYAAVGRLVKTPLDIEPRLTMLLTAHYRAVIDAFGLRVLRGRKADSQFETLIQRYIATDGAARIQGITGTTRQAIQSVISASEKDGLGNQATGKAIFDKMRGSFSRNRAATIARTETHSAASYANHEVNKSLGIPNQKKRWVATNDIRTRSWHSAMNGVEVEADEDFTVYHNGIEYKMGYTGDPRGGASNTINCRCITLYITPEDEIEDDAPRDDAGITKPWGEAKPEEVEMHNQSWSKAMPAILLRVIQKTKQVDELEFGVKGAYARGGPQGGKTIAVHNKRGQNVTNTNDAGIWRHEYGHHIDMSWGRRINNENYISLKVAPSMQLDKNEYRKNKRDAAREGTRSDISKFLDETGFNPTTDDVLSFAKQAGLDERDLEAYFSKVGWKDIDVRRNVVRFIAAVKNKDFGYLEGDLPSFNTLEFEGPMLADYLGAITTNTVGWGHSKAYYTGRRNIRRGYTSANTTEGMANYSGLMGSQNRESWRKLMEIFAPETTRAFDNIFEEIDDFNS